MKRDAIIAAAACILAGLGVATMITLFPEGLKAPAWVAYAAAAAFVLCGFVIISADLRAWGANRALIVALLLAMFAPPAWIAFGAGERACRLGGELFGIAATGLMCRVPFGVGALVLGWMMIVAWHSKPKKHDE